jgi:hypothetical protein
VALDNPKLVIAFLKLFDGDSDHRS